MISVPYTSFSKIVKQNKKIFTKKFHTTLTSGQYINGKEVKIFEKKFANFCGTSYATGTSNGTCALRMGIAELGLKPNSEIITPPNSFIASTSSIISNNLKPCFVDISEDWNMNIDLVEEKINKNTKAIMAVHLTGRPQNMIKLKRIAKKYNLYIIEDCAQAVGALYNKKRVGGFGDIGTFSLHPLKNLFAFGDGGIITSNSKKLINGINIRKNHGLSSRDTCDYFSCNCRLDELQAALLNVQLKNIDKITLERRKLAKIYNDELKDIVRVPIENSKEYHVYQTYVIFAEKRDELQKHLLKKRISSVIHYPTPIHLQPAAKKLGYKIGNFPITEKLSKEVLSLPLFIGMSSIQQQYVIKEIKNFYK